MVSLARNKNYIQTTPEFLFVAKNLGLHILIFQMLCFQLNTVGTSECIDIREHNVFPTQSFAEHRQLSLRETGERERRKQNFVGVSLEKAISPASASSVDWGLSRWWPRSTFRRRWDLGWWSSLGSPANTLTRPWGKIRWECPENLCTHNFLIVWLRSPQTLAWLPSWDTWEKCRNTSNHLRIKQRSWSSSPGVRPALRW